MKDLRVARFRAPTEVREHLTNLRHGACNLVLFGSNRPVGQWSLVHGVSVPTVGRSKLPWMRSKKL